MKSADRLRTPKHHKVNTICNFIIVKCSISETSINLSNITSIQKYKVNVRHIVQTFVRWAARKISTQLENMWAKMKLPMLSNQYPLYIFLIYINRTINVSLKRYRCAISHTAVHSLHPLHELHIFHTMEF